jgi:hypothetical protein
MDDFVRVEGASSARDWCGLRVASPIRCRDALQRVSLVLDTALTSEIKMPLSAGYTEGCT